MSLGLFIGILLDLQDDEPDKVPIWQAQFECVNQALEAAGIPRHREPTEARAGLPWSVQMYGYSGLHYLRRVAAYIAAGRDLPSPGEGRVTGDPVLRHYYDQSTIPNDENERRFPHLICHSDCEGFYLPLAFREPIVPDESFGVWDGSIGSSVALLDECSRLASILQIPSDLDAESDEVEDACDSGQGQGAELWQRYGIESYTCLRLMKGCRLSLATGSALAFA